MKRRLARKSSLTRKLVRQAAPDKVSGSQPQPKPLGWEFGLALGAFLLSAFYRGPFVWSG